MTSLRYPKYVNTFTQYIELLDTLNCPHQAMYWKVQLRNHYGYGLMEHEYLLQASKDLKELGTRVLAINSGLATMESALMDLGVPVICTDLVKKRPFVHVMDSEVAAEMYSKETNCLFSSWPPYMKKNVYDSVECAKKYGTPFKYVLHVGESEVDGCIDGHQIQLFTEEYVKLHRYECFRWGDLVDEGNLYCLRR